MAQRKIVVISTTKSQPKEFYSEATTYGQIQDSLRDFGDLTKMRAVVKESKATLELSEAALPDGDFTLYLTPKQIKAGGVDLVEVLRALQEKMSEGFDQVIEALEDGEYGDPEEAAAAVVAKVAGPVITTEDQRMLNELANLR